VFWTSFSIFFVCLMAESITSWMFIRGSRKKHPILWEHAGEPTLIENGDLISAISLVEYVRRREYSEISDIEAVQFAEKLRRPLVYSYWMTVVSVAIFLGSLLFTNLTE